jgi:hypothetical protein
MLRQTQTGQKQASASDRGGSCGDGRRGGRGGDAGTDGQAGGRSVPSERYCRTDALVLVGGLCFCGPHACNNADASAGAHGGGVGQHMPLLCSAGGGGAGVPNEDKLLSLYRTALRAPATSQLLASVPT